MDLEQARALPELAVLSTLMHGRRGSLSADAVLAALSSEDMRALLEVVMKNESFPYESEFARENYERGMAEGEAKGVAAGKAEGLRTVLIALCRAHGIEWTDARAANVTALDTDTLERLIVRVSAERRWPDDA